MLAFQVADTLELRDESTYELRKTLKIHRSDVKSLSFSPDGRMMAVAQKSNWATIWDVENGIKVQEIDKMEVCTTCFDNTGNRLLCKDSNGRGFIWDMILQESSCEFLCPTGGLLTPPACFSESGDTFITTYAVYGTAPEFGFIVYGSNDGREIFRKCVETNTKALIRSVNFSCIDNCFATASSDGMLLLWSNVDYSLLSRFTSTGSLCRVKFFHSSQRVAAGGNAGVHIWDYRTQELLLTIPIRFAEIRSLSISADETKVAFTYDSEKLITVAHTATGMKLFSNVAVSESACCFSPSVMVLM